MHMREAYLAERRGMVQAPVDRTHHRRRAREGGSADKNGVRFFFELVHAGTMRTFARELPYVNGGAERS